MTFDLGLNADLKMLNICEGIASARTTFFCLFCFAEHHSGDRSEVAPKATPRPNEPKVVDPNNLKKSRGQVTIKNFSMLNDFRHELTVIILTKKFCLRNTNAFSR